MKRIDRFVVSSLCIAVSCSAMLAVPAFAQADSGGADKGSRLQGTAAIDRRDRVVGALVTVHRPDDPSRLFLTSTDASGVFQVDNLPNGEYAVKLERSGFETVTKDRVQVRFPFRAVVEVTMRRSDSAVLTRKAPTPAGSGERVTFGGAIRERGGEPVAEVRVRLVHPEGKRDPRRVESAADGSFRFDDLAAGEWLLDLDAVGFLPMRVRLGVAGDTRVDVSLVRQPADYEPSPLELMPPEQLKPPPGFLEETAPATPAAEDGEA